MSIQAPGRAPCAAVASHACGGAASRRANAITAAPPVTSASAANGTIGMPGTSASTSISAAAPASARGCASSCPAISSPIAVSLRALATRVTSRPAAIAMISDGICATRPSPTDKSE